MSGVFLWSLCSAPLVWTPVASSIASCGAGLYRDFYIDVIINRLDRPWLIRLLHGLVAKMAVKVNANKGGAWNNTWGVQVNPEGHDHGLAMTLVGCPLAGFAKTHGYTEIMPWLCRVDERTASAIHARLIRHHTVAQGHETCDYWYVGDQDPSV